MVFLSGVVIGMAGGYLSASVLPPLPFTKVTAAPPDGLPPDIALMDLSGNRTTQDAHQSAPVATASAEGDDSTRPAASRPQASEKSGANAETAPKSPAKTATPGVAGMNSGGMREEPNTKHPSVAPANSNAARPERRRQRSEQRTIANASDETLSTRGRHGRPREIKNYSGSRKK